MMPSKKLMQLCGIALIILPLSFSFVLAAEKVAKPTIDAIDGDDLVVIRTAQGNRPAKVGAALSSGDRIKTGPASSLRVKYPDGSTLIIGSLSEVAIQEIGPVKKVSLGYGQTRAVIQKSSLQEKLKNAPTHRFLVKTPTATMGVRGTDFVTESVKAKGFAGASTQLHTLEGVVDVARNESDLTQGKFTSVTQGNQVAADTTGIQNAQPFDRAKFVDELKSEQPGFQKLSPPDSPLTANAPPEPVQSLGEAPPPGENVPQVPSGVKTPVYPTVAPQLRYPQVPNETPMDNVKDGKPVDDRPPSIKKAEEEQKKKEEDEWSKFKLLSFEVAYQEFNFASSIVRPGNNFGRWSTWSVHSAWTPLLRPVKYLGVRGFVGYGIHRLPENSGSLLSLEWRVGPSVYFLKYLYAELLFGKTHWFFIGGPKSGFEWGPTVGFYLGEKAFIERIFISKTDLKINPNVDSLRIGIGKAF